MLRFFLSPVYSFFGFAISVAALLGIWGMALPMSRSQPPERKTVPPTLENALDRLCRDIPTALPEPDRVLCPVLVLPFAGDRDGLVTEKVRSALTVQGWYRPVDIASYRHLLETTKTQLGFTEDFTDRIPSLAPRELALLAAEAKAEIVLRGTVEQMTLPQHGKPQLVLTVELWAMSDSNVPTGPILSKRFEFPEPAATVSRDAISFFQGQWWSILPVWLVFGLLWPMMMLSWLRKTLQAENNAANLGMLLGMAAIPAFLLAIFLFFFGFSKGTILLLTCVYAVFLFFYTAWIMNRLQA